MPGVAEGIAAIFALGLLGLGIRRIGGTYLKFRGTRVIACPQTKDPAAVELALWRAAFAAAFRVPALGLRTCSVWHGRPVCGQECLKQIEAAPEESLVRTILTKWYQGRQCAACGRELGEIHWRLRQPCLVSPELEFVEWKDIRPEKIPDALKTHQPVCWTCLVSETHTW